MKLSIKVFSTCLLVLLTTNWLILATTTSTSTETISTNRVLTNNKSKNKAKSQTQTLTMTSTLFEMQSYINMMTLMSSKTKSNESLKLKSKTKKNQLDRASEENDIFNFMSILSSSNKNNFAKKQKRQAFNPDDISSQYKFKSKEENTEEIPEKVVQPNPSSKKKIKTLKDDEFQGNKELGLVFENWWTISSREFKDYKNYPPLTLSNGTKIEIITNGTSRLNPAFNCTDADKPKTPYQFWFRMNDLNMYYSSSKTDVNILGEIDWDSVVDVTESEKKVNNTSIYCFQTNDKDNKNWILCNEDKAERHKWVCRIKLLLQLPKDGSCADVFGEEPMKPNVEIKKIQPEVVIPLPSRECNENWSYRFNGKDWECTCKEGMEQSPIDLPLPHLVTDSPVKPLFQYSEVGPESDITTLDNLVMAGEDIKLRNFDGHLTLYHHNFGKVVTLDGAVFKAEEITFHTPSNHKIDGKSFPLEVSIIHYGISKGDIAKQVILSFLFEKKAGIYNQFIDDLDFLNLPNTSQKVKNIINKIYIPKILFEARGENDDQIIMMKPFSFYTYQGSLPFPPCTERTIHYVASKPLRIGSTALQLFTEALRVPDQIKSDGSSFDVIVSDTLPVSNREIQELKGRPIFHYDHKKYCPMGDPPKPEVKPLGHYEKMKRDVTNYFFVTGTKPSGIPGAFVVPNEEAGH
jgi:carbonic anhydrase